MLDGNGGANGRLVANVGGANVALLQNTRPQVFYWDVSNDHLRRARYDGSAWHFETADGQMNGPNGPTTAQVGSSNSAIVDGNRLRVFTFDETNNNLRHGWFG